MLEGTLRFFQINGVGGIAQQMKTFAAKPDELNSAKRTFACLPSHEHAYTYNYNGTFLLATTVFR